MSDAIVEAVARAICRCSCSTCATVSDCWDWKGAAGAEAEAAVAAHLAALEAEGYAVVPVKQGEWSGQTWEAALRAGGWRPR